MAHVSAPGKVLLCGGYLVLEQPNTGLVVSVSARLHATVTTEPLPASDQAEATGSDALLCKVRVHSPQFAATFDYTFGCTYPDLVCSLGSASAQESRFLETAIVTSLAVACARATDWEALRAALHGQCLVLTVAADNDFYSQVGYLQKRGLAVTSAALRDIPKQNPDIRDSAGGIGKTGLGSSACLVTSVVGALLHHCGTVRLPRRTVDVASYAGAAGAADARALVHAAAQFAHCYAQGKVGSGFDVCAATYGSGVYARFDPKVLTAAMEAFATAGTPARQLVRLLDVGAPAPPIALDDAVPEPPQGWDHAFVPFALPKPLALVLADINGGSSTPGMVSKVLQWKAVAPPGERALWERLAVLNPQLITLFRELGRILDEEAQRGVVQVLCQTAFADWPSVAMAGTGAVVECLTRIRRAFTEIRGCLKRIGELCGADIEPDPQTALIEATLAVPGVLIAGVPGAGGYDAVFAVLLADSVRPRVEHLWLQRGAPAADSADTPIVPLVLDEEPFGIAVE